MEANMIATIKFKFGEVIYELEIDEKSEMETLHKAIVLGNPPKKCDVCGKSESYLTSNKDKEGNTYINAKCLCGARAKLGQYKAGGYFWHDYKTISESIKQSGKDEVVTANDEVDIDDIPFENDVEAK